MPHKTAHLGTRSQNSDPLLTKNLPFFQKTKICSTLNSYSESCFWFISLSKVFLRSLECVLNDKVEFYEKFHILQFLILWTFLYSSPNSVHTSIHLFGKDFVKQRFWWGKIFHAVCKRRQLHFD